MNPRSRLAGLLAAALVAAAGATSASAAPQSIAVPAYFYPSYPDPVWTRMQDAAPAVAFAVMNPASGPGPSSDSSYVSQVAATRAAGVKVLGYVASGYATRDPALLKAEIDNYYAWYSVDGIFIDEAENHCVNAAYYADLNAYTKTKGGSGLTVINPGTVTPECFVTSADIILNFEGSHAQYLAWTPSGWESGYDPSHFWHLVYDTAEADMPSTVLLSQARGAGYVYVTPDTLVPNPWDSLPVDPYWSSEIGYVRSIGGACSTSVVKPRLQVNGVSTAAADDTLKFSGQFTLAGEPVIDPVANGLRVVVGDSSGTVVDATLSPGAAAAGVGWIVAHRSWRYRSTAAMPAFGIRSASVKTKFDGVSTLVTFKISGSRASYPVDATKLPLAAALLLEPGAPNSNCATASFPGPARPVCVVTGAGKGIRCQ